MSPSPGRTPAWLLMVAVASLALLIGGGAMKVRSKSYRAKAAAHGAAQINATRRMDLPGAKFHGAMRDKWRAAASRPWNPVTPDPPEPR